MKTKTFNEKQFFNISRMRDPKTDRFSKEVESMVKKEFVDGFKFRFANAPSSYDRAEVHKSLDGKIGIFFYHYKSAVPSSYVCDYDLQNVLVKTYDVIYVFPR